MYRAALVLLVVASALTQVVAATGACAGVDPVPPCESPLDCDLREACIDGTCTSSGEGENESGEGEGEGPNVAAAIQGACLRVAQCQGGVPDECARQLQSQVDQMSNVGSDVCFRAVDALAGFLVCVQGLTCEQFNNDPNGACPGQAEASNLQSQCFNGKGVGEGEGEGEGGEGE